MFSDWLLMENTIFLRYPLRYALFILSLWGMVMWSAWWLLVACWFVIWRKNLLSRWLVDPERKPLVWWVKGRPWWVALIGLGMLAAVTGCMQLTTFMFEEV